jgi:hypothetical protein
MTRRHPWGPDSPLVSFLLGLLFVALVLLIGSEP